MSTSGNVSHGMASNVIHDIAERIAQWYGRYQFNLLSSDDNVNVVTSDQHYGEDVGAHDAAQHLLLKPPSPGIMQQDDFNSGHHQIHSMWSDSVPTGPSLSVLLLELLALFYIFGCLAIAAERLCDAMETLCKRLKVPQDVAGATFMALGGSIPEICINLICALTESGGGDASDSDGNADDDVIDSSWSSRLSSPKWSLLTNSLSSKHNTLSTVSKVNLGIGAILGSGLIAFCVIPSVCILFSKKGIVIPTPQAARKRRERRTGIDEGTRSQSRTGQLTSDASRRAEAAGNSHVGTSLPDHLDDDDFVLSDDDFVLSGDDLDSRGVKKLRSVTGFLDEATRRKSAGAKSAGSKSSSASDGNNGNGNSTNSATSGAASSSAITISIFDADNGSRLLPSSGEEDPKESVESEESVDSEESEAEEEGSDEEGGESVFVLSDQHLFVMEDHEIFQDDALELSDHLEDLQEAKKEAATSSSPSSEQAAKLGRFLAVPGASVAASDSGRGSNSPVNSASKRRLSGRASSVGDRSPTRSPSSRRSPRNSGTGSEIFHSFARLKRRADAEAQEEVQRKTEDTLLRLSASHGLPRRSRSSSRLSDVCATEFASARSSFTGSENEFGGCSSENPSNYKSAGHNYRSAGDLQYYSAAGGLSELPLAKEGVAVGGPHWDASASRKEPLLPANVNDMGAGSLQVQSEGSRPDGSAQLRNQRKMVFYRRQKYTRLLHQQKIQLLRARAQKKLILKRRPLLRDIAGYLSCLGLLLVCIRVQRVSSVLAGMFIVLYGTYILVLVFSGRIRRMWRRREAQKAQNNLSSATSPDQEGASTSPGRNADHPGPNPSAATSIENANYVRQSKLTSTGEAPRKAAQAPGEEEVTGTSYNNLKNAEDFKKGADIAGGLIQNAGDKNAIIQSDWGDKKNTQKNVAAKNVKMSQQNMMDVAMDDMSTDAGTADASSVWSAATSGGTSESGVATPNILSNRPHQSKKNQNPPSLTTPQTSSPAIQTGVVTQLLPDASSQSLVDADDDEDGVVIKIAKVVWWPATFVCKLVCPDCSPGQPRESW